MKTGDIVDWVNGMGIILTGIVVDPPWWEGERPLVRESRLGTMLRPRNAKVTRSGDTYGGPTGYAGDSTAPPERGMIMYQYNIIKDGTERSQLEELTNVTDEIDRIMDRFAEGAMLVSSDVLGTPHNRATVHLVTDPDERVSAGMAWLDERYPGHEHRFDAGRFSITSPMRCALAQASGKCWSDAASDQGMDVYDVGDYDNIADLGFVIINEADRAPLELAWIKAYAARHNG